MSPEVVALLIQLGIKLLPTAEDALVKVFALLVALIPDPAGSDKAFLAECIRVVSGIRHDDPDFSEVQIRRYATDAIKQLAADEGRVLDETVFTTLGLV